MPHKCPVRGSGRAHPAENVGTLSLSPRPDGSILPHDNAIIPPESSARRGTAYPAGTATKDTASLEGALVVYRRHVFHPSRSDAQHGSSAGFCEDVVTAGPA